MRKFSLLAAAALNFAGLWALGQDKKPADQALPEFPEGHKWNKYHAVVQTQNYDAFLHLTGGLEVFPKSGDKNIGEPIIFCRWTIDYTSAPHVNHRRFIREYTNKPQAQENPRRLVLEGICQDPVGPDKSEVKFAVMYEFAADRISFTWGMEDPRRGLQFASRINVNTNIPPSHKFDETATLEERKKTLGSHFLQVQSIKDRRNRRIRYPYDQVLVFENPLDKAVLEGHYAPRTVEMEAGKGSSFNGAIYAGNCPWQGYRFHRSTNQIKINQHKFFLTIK